MQDSSLVLSGGIGTVVAPCVSEGFELSSKAASFKFQYAVHYLEAPTMVSGPQKPAVGDPVGGTADAEGISATDFRMTVETQRGCPWRAGDTIGYISGGGATDTIAIRPRRAGGN